MGFVYFSIPCIGGYYAFQYTQAQAELNLVGLRGVEGGIGNVAPDGGLLGGKAELGKGGGVRLMTSNVREQEMNARRLKAMFDKLEKDKKA